MAGMGMRFVWGGVMGMMKDVWAGRAMNHGAATYYLNATGPNRQLALSTITLPPPSHNWTKSPIFSIMPKLVIEASS
jgi:hypothetical protein